MLSKLFKSLVPVVASLATVQVALGFSLLGPFDPNYQTTTIGYNLPITTSARNGDLGGPMNLHEEYRWNSPFIVYGFDGSFIEYFGDKGVAAVEAAIAQLNALPAMSELSQDLSEYPLDAIRFNYTAQQLGIVDIKSVVMALMLEQLGLAAPERYVKTILKQDPNTAAPNFDYSVIVRNFDPVPVIPGDFRAYSYSPYINGSLYTFVIRHNTLPVEFWDAQDIALDVANPRVSVASLAGLQAGLTDPRIATMFGTTTSLTQPGAGLFFKGFTRDDIGGLRYLYHPSRTNVEALPTGSVLGSGISSGGGGGGVSGTPWTITIPFISTNATPAAGTNGTTTAGLVNLAWRGGVDKLAFVRIDPDPFVNQFPRALFMTYTERVFDASRGRFVNQNVSRQFLRPDITFAAFDIGQFTDYSAPYTYSRTIGAFNNRSVENSGIPLPLPVAGPGTIDAGGTGSQIILNKVGPWNLVFGPTSEDESTRGFVFGSFDGSTNSPTVFPTSVSAKDLERIIFGRN